MTDFDREYSDGADGAVDAAVSLEAGAGDATPDATPEADMAAPSPDRRRCLGFCESWLMCAGSSPECRRLRGRDKNYGFILGACVHECLSPDGALEAAGANGPVDAATCAAVRSNPPAEICTSPSVCQQMCADQGGTVVFDACLDYPEDSTCEEACQATANQAWSCVGERVGFTTDGADYCSALRACIEF